MSDVPLRALTLWRPWPCAILWLPPDERKGVENRPWKPWLDVIGKRIAIHAGRFVDDGAADVTRLAEQAGVQDHLLDQGLIGTVRVLGWVRLITDYQGRSLFMDDAGTPVHYGVHYGGSELTATQRANAVSSRWFFGATHRDRPNYGWVLDDPRPLSEPIPCAGAQGLWLLSAHQQHEIQRLELRP